MDGSEDLRAGCEGSSGVEVSGDTSPQGACGDGKEEECTISTSQDPESVSVTTFSDKAEFLNVIHLEFLKVVHPVESGLVDILRSLDVVSSDEENEIEGEKTRRDKARRLWHILHKVPSMQFAEDVKNSSSAAVASTVAKMLSDKKLPVSADFQQLLQDGFQCTCKVVPLEQLPKFELLKPLMSLKLEDEESSGAYPSSPLSYSGESRVDSGIGYALESVCSEEFESDQPNLEQFSTLTEKLQFKAVNNKLNEARVYAASIRTQLRFLEGRRDEVRNIMKKAKDEGPDYTTSKAEVDGLLHRAAEAQKEIEQLYERIDKTAQETKDLDKCFDFELPPTQRRGLLQIKHKLESDFVEAQHFANTSKTVLQEIVHCCSPLSNPADVATPTS
ncbi:hypothetical protein BaRGS_00019431 [Batillaria attramentaria]|uniref:CARD domain-containing protein n=1 Tax=Batillaria attramentaria TaxID=370345 RepID=A0ABD0KPY1_9CAEN